MYWLWWKAFKRTAGTEGRGQVAAVALYDLITGMAS